MFNEIINVSRSCENVDLIDIGLRLECLGNALVLVLLNIGLWFIGGVCLALMFWGIWEVINIIEKKVIKDN